MRTSILGSKLRSLSRTTVNGLAEGKTIPVQFRGTGAYTTGKMVSLPKINDLSDIEWPTAKALLGYAVHEVAHVRLTDFVEVARSAKLGVQVQHFANAIEDYRIERDMIRRFKGCIQDLTALRNRVHPEADFQPARWYADPRKCGALALTWTGSQLNNIPIPAMRATLEQFPDPVMTMLTRWTNMMKDITSTKEAVDLAILFVAEAEKYADAMKQAANNQPPPSGQGDDDSAGDQSDSQHDDGDDQGAPSPSTGDNNNPANDTDTDCDKASGNDPSADRDDAIDPSADLEDLLDQLADQIAQSVAQTGAPDVDATADDGEINPQAIDDSISNANANAPDYNTTDQDTTQSVPTAGKQGSNNSYNNQIATPVTPAGDGSYLSELTSTAAGTIATTARVIKRLLMSEEKNGVLRNRRDGEFDIRNLSAIVRNTGTAYKRNWTQPSPRTLLVSLVDFSGSMNGPRLDLAMTGTLALLKATRNTQVKNWVYGYTGMSNAVRLYEIASQRTPDALAMRRIDSAKTLQKVCTPTGEAIAEMLKLMVYAEEERRVLLVLTDGDADNADLCKSAAEFARKHGIEVVAIGIQSQSVSRWAPVYEVIQNIEALPDALLRTIDPRQSRKKAA